MIGRHAAIITVLTAFLTCLFTVSSNTAAAADRDGNAEAAPDALARGQPQAPSARLYFLDTRGRRLLSANPDGSGLTVVVPRIGGLPDGIVVDRSAGHIYWTNMVTLGAPGASNGGSVQRVDLDGSRATAIVPVGITFRPKEMVLDKQHGKLYWSDREGMRVMRANLDGSGVETLIETGERHRGKGDPSKYCVGIALDLARGQIYWTQRGDQSDDSSNGSIRRANIEIPEGESAANRSDIQVLFDGLSEPVDLALDLTTRTMYWTSDGGAPPKGNTVSRAPMDPPQGADPKKRTDQQILVRGLRGGIGISLDLAHGRMYFADLGGHVYRANLDGSDETTLLSGVGAVTGVTYVPAPPAPKD
jgi:sugar lactone lactonase YvrE